MNYAVIFAGGTGTRMNTKTKPKQFLTLHNKEIIIYTLEHFENHPEIDGISVVCIEGWIDYLKKLIEKYQLKKVKWITPGGKTGQESIYNGLNAMRGQIEEDSIVLIHDGVQATETVMMVNEKNELTQSVERKKCRFARAPQTYIYGQLLAAHDHAREENINSYIDSATLMQAEGYKLFPVMGKPENIKITTPSDFYTFRAIVEAEENSQILGF